LEKNIGIEKHAGKVRKDKCCLMSGNSFFISFTRKTSMSSKFIIIDKVHSFKRWGKMDYGLKLWALK
jgi:hypothetical protein